MTARAKFAAVILLAMLLAGAPAMHNHALAGDTGGLNSQSICVVCIYAAVAIFAVATLLAAGIEPETDYPPHRLVAAPQGVVLSLPSRAPPAV